MGFYKKLYKQELVPEISFLPSLVNSISREDANWLETFPAREEIRDAVWACDPTKAPNADGYNMNFIRKMWSEIGVEFYGTIEDFFVSGSLPRGSNMTWVTLIPKVEGAKEIKEFRPISMVRSVHKVISKILPNGLRNVIPKLVGETQSAFVCGRQILDGALIACEVVH